MKYFMLAWESHNDSAIHNDISDIALRNAIKQHIGKEAPTEESTTIDEDIAKIGEDLQMLTGQISNIVFFQTDNYDITENTIAYWLNQKVGRALFDYHKEVYIKQVPDPYPLLKLFR